MKRIVVAALFGVVAGLFCLAFTALGHLMPLTAVTVGWILLNRTVMGLVIGVSGLKCHWAWNGVVLGLVVGEIFSYFLFMNLGIKALLLTPIGNAIFGLMIELFTTVVFKAPAFARAEPRVMEHAVAA